MNLVAPDLRATLRELVSGGKPWPLYLYGPSGGGKSRAALALADFCKTSFYAWPSDLCSIEKAGDFAAWRAIAQVELAVLDELGTRRDPSAFEYDMVHRFATLRDERPGRVAVYISNCSPKELQDAYDDRIASRMLCGTLFHLQANDRRATR